MREVDLHPTVGSLLRRYIAGRTSGLLFSTLSGKPLHLANILKHHLHPALQSLGYLQFHYTLVPKEELTSAESLLKDNLTPYGNTQLELRGRLAE